MSIFHIIGISATLILIVGLSVYTGRLAKDTSKKSGSGVVAGLIMGTLVGGASTVGTAQLAYSFGMSAWWFTLGGGIACLVLALFFVRPFRRMGCPTLLGMITRDYGPTVGMTASVLNSVGTFINIISQLLAGTAVIAVVFPSLGLFPELLITAVFMVLYVIFGGAKGAGIVGIVKLILLYVSMMACGLLVLIYTNGFGGFVDMVHGIDNPDGVAFFSVFARGFGKDFGACLSMVFGILTTQTYAQAVLSTETDRQAVKGALISAVLIPPIGVGGILVGLYMRAVHPGALAKTALTAFVLESMPDLLAGVILGTLFIAVVGTGAGLALGISSILNYDLIKQFTHRFDSPRANGALSKALIVAILLLACFLSAGNIGDVILNFSFMSMGLRGAVVFAPLCAALWLPGKIPRSYAMAAIITGPTIVLVFNTVFPLSFDPLIIGITAAVLIMAAGYLQGKNRRLQEVAE
jgi:SSS family solute:Na+ symporter